MGNMLAVKLHEGKWRVFLWNEAAFSWVSVDDKLFDTEAEARVHLAALKSGG